MTSSNDWKEIQSEVEDLYRMHGSGIADFPKCRDFGHRLSLLLERLEDLNEDRMADRVMDLMSGCSPKEGSHCDLAMATKARLETLITLIKQKSE